MTDLRENVRAHDHRAAHDTVLQLTPWRLPDTHPETEGGASYDHIFPVRVRNDAFGDPSVRALMADSPDWWSVATIDADGQWLIAAPTWDDEWRQAHAQCVVTGWCYPDELARADRPAPVVDPDDWREAIASAYVAGATAVHENHQPGAEPDFAEAAYDYAADQPPPAPAPVVVKELEWRGDASAAVAYCDFGQYAAWGDGAWEFASEPTNTPQVPTSLEAAKAACQADYTRRILSAVNAVSEAQVRADERERLAKLAEAELFHDWIEGKFEGGPEDFARWLRAQGEGK